MLSWRLVTFADTRLLKLLVSSQSWLLHDVKLVRKIAELMPPLEGLASMNNDDRRVFASSVAEHLEMFLKDLQDENGVREDRAVQPGAADAVEDEVEMWQSKVQLMVKVITVMNTDEFRGCVAMT